jgi:hypothetical protein
MKLSRLVRLDPRLKRHGAPEDIRQPIRRAPLDDRRGFAVSAWLRGVTWLRGVSLGFLFLG